MQSRMRKRQSWTDSRRKKLSVNLKPMDLQLDFPMVLWAILKVSPPFGQSLMIVGHLNIGAGRVVWQVLVLTTQWTYIRILCVSINLSKRTSEGLVEEGKENDGIVLLV